LIEEFFWENVKLKRPTREFFPGRVNSQDAEPLEEGKWLVNRPQPQIDQGHQEEDFWTKQPF